MFPSHHSLAIALWGNSATVSTEHGVPMPWVALWLTRVVFPTGVRSWLVRRAVRRWQKAAEVIQTAWRRWRVSRVINPTQHNGLAKNALHHEVSCCMFCCDGTNVTFSLCGRIYKKRRDRYPCNLATSYVPAILCLA